MVWRWGEEKTYFGILAQVLLGEMSYWDDIPPKGSKDELGPLGAAMTDRKREREHSHRSTTSKQTK